MTGTDLRILVDGHTHITNRVHWEQIDPWEPQPFEIALSTADSERRAIALQGWSAAHRSSSPGVTQTVAATTSPPRKLDDMQRQVGVSG